MAFPPAPSGIASQIWGPSWQTSISIPSVCQHCIHSTPIYRYRVVGICSRIETHQGNRPAHCLPWVVVSSAYLSGRDASSRANVKQILLWSGWCIPSREPHSPQEVPPLVRMRRKRWNMHPDWYSRTKRVDDLASKGRSCLPLWPRRLPKGSWCCRLGPASSIWFASCSMSLLSSSMQFLW